MAGLGARTATGAVWTSASYAAGRVLVFVGLTTVARILRPDEYGLFGMAALGVNLLEGSYDFGLRRGLIYLGGTVGPRLLTTGFVLALGLGAGLTGLLFALTPLVASFYGEPRVTTLMQVLSVYFGIACLGVVPDALLQHRLAFNRRFLPSIAAPAGRYLIAVPLALLGFGAWSLAWGQLIGISLEVVSLFVLAGWRPGVGWSRSAARALIHYSSQVSVVEWLAAIALNLDYLLVGHFLGSSVLGLYTLAFKLPDTTIGAAGYIGSRVLLPAFVDLKEHEQSIADGFLQALRLLAIVLTPLAAGLFLLSPQIVPLLFGDWWTEAVPVVQLLAVSACVNGLLQAVGAAFLAAGQPRKILAAQTAWIAVLVPALYIAAQVSIVAVAAAHVIGAVVFAAVKVALVPSALHVAKLDIARALAPGLLATGAMVLVLVPVLRVAAPLPAWGILLAAVVIGAVTYVAGVGLFDRSLVRQICRRWLAPVGVAPTTRRRLSVMMFIQSYYPRIGGAESNLQALVGPLRNAGIDVAILTRRFPGMAARADVAGAPVYRMPVSGGQLQASLSYIANSVWVLVRSRPAPDLLHAHELRSPTLAAIVAGWVLQRPVVAHVLRGGLLGDVAVLRTAPLGGARMCLFKHAVAQFVAVSRETRRELLEAGVPENRITLVSYGVDTARFCPATAVQRANLRQRLGFDGRKVVLVVARLVPEKGFDGLLAAWPAVKTAVPSAALVIVGDGCQREALTRQAQDLKDVDFLGARHDPLPYLQGADCFTLPSFTEGQPISLLEAMAMGLPCVATNIGGISDILGAVPTGTLVPPGDTARLSDALIRMLDLDETTRALHAVAARQHVVKYHSIEANAAALRRLYGQLTGADALAG